MVTSSKPPAPRRADDIVDAYLDQRFGVGLEQVLLDATAGRLTAGLAGVVTFEVRHLSRWPYADRGAADFYAGKLVVDGVHYAFRAQTYCEEYGPRFLQAVDEFEVEGWTADIRISNARA